MQAASHFISGNGQRTLHRLRLRLPVDHQKEGASSPGRWHRQRAMAAGDMSVHLGRVCRSAGGHPPRMERRRMGLLQLQKCRGGSQGGRVLYHRRHQRPQG